MPTPCFSGLMTRPWTGLRVRDAELGVDLHGRLIAWYAANSGWDPRKKCAGWGMEIAESQGIWAWPEYGRDVRGIVEDPCSD